MTQANRYEQVIHPATDGSPARLDVCVCRNGDTTAYLCGPCKRARQRKGRDVTTVGYTAPGVACEDCEAAARRGPKQMEMGL